MILIVVDILLRHILFFGIGMFQDIFLTFYYQAISKEHAGRAGIISTAVTLINLAVLYNILAGIESQVWSIILVYAIGNGVGTAVVIKRHLVKRYIVDKMRGWKRK